jgi:alpha-L-arabinofuranosidase
VHQDAKLLPLNLQSATYTFGGESLPAVSGSASVDSLGRTHITLTNIDANKAQEVNISVKGAAFKSVAGRILASARLQDYNSFENPNKIQPARFSGATLGNDNLKVTLPPFSVVALELK